MMNYSSEKNNLPPKQRRLNVKMWVKGAIALAIVAVFCTTYSLIMPATTMTDGHIGISAEETNKAFNEDITVDISAKAGSKQDTTIFYLLTDYENAELTGQTFGEDQTSVITDKDGTLITINREVKDDGTYNYWFELEKDKSTVFSLSFRSLKIATGQETTGQTTYEETTEETTYTEETQAESATVPEETETSVPAETAISGDPSYESANETDLQETGETSFSETEEPTIATETETPSVETKAETSMQGIDSIDPDSAAVMIYAGCGNEKDEAETAAEKAKTSEPGEDGYIEDKDGNILFVSLTWSVQTDEDEAENDEIKEVEYEDDNVKIVVSESQAGIIPENSTLSVSPIVEGDSVTQEKYKEVDSKLQDAADNGGYSITGFLAYDISFVDVNGKEVEPNGEVSVSMQYKEATLPDSVTEEDVTDSNVTVMHLQENEEGIVQDAVDMNESNKITDIKTTETNEIESAEFTTDSFSVYTITWTKRGKDYTYSMIYWNADSSVAFDDVGGDKSLSVSTGTGYALPAADTVLDISGYVFQYVSIGTDSPETQISQLRLRGGSIQYQVAPTTSGDGWTSGSWYDLGSNNVYMVYSTSADSSLTQIDTVDSVAKGISIAMTDFSSAGNGLSSDIQGGYNGNGPVTQGLVEATLGTDGYPLTTYNSAGVSLKNCFSTSSTVSANHLFSQEIYDRTGYYEYCSFDNYAYLNSNTANFTVYNQLGTTKESADSSLYFYYRGNFLPYNPIEKGRLSSCTNLFDEDGTALATTNSRYGEDLYWGVYLPGATSVDYYFGMNITAKFTQPKDGIESHTYNGTTTTSEGTFKFNGDDDMWVFIDNTLVLDIGGIHDAHSGSINFATGAVNVVTGDPDNPNASTTIKQMFEDAGVFPDGTTWDDTKVDEYFDGDTFIDYSAHTLKVFYMERGAGASNLRIRFNLPVVEKSSVNVKKELTGVNSDYVNENYAYQIYAQEITGEDEVGGEVYGTNYVLLDSATYKDTGEAVNFTNTTINGTAYNNVFYLKAGQTAVFSNIQENRKYYVVELGVDGNKYDTVTVNGTEHTLTEGTVSDISSTEESVSEQPITSFINNYKDSNKLEITKELETGETDSTFTFQVYLENENGILETYKGDYYLKDQNGNYYYYDTGGDLVSTSTETVCKATTDGTIPDIKIGYTVVIDDLSAGTEFLVVEIGFDTEVFDDPNKVVTVGTAGDGTLFYNLIIADGTIKESTDAQVVITNALKGTSYLLPATGGVGILFYILIGCGLMVGSIAVGYNLKRKRERRSGG